MVVGILQIIIIVVAELQLQVRVEPDRPTIVIHIGSNIIRLNGVLTLMT